MPCKKCALNFKKRHFEENLKSLAIFKSLPLPFGSMYFNETWNICLVVLCFCQEKIRKDLLECVWRFCNPKFEN